MLFASPDLGGGLIARSKVELPPMLDEALTAAGSSALAAFAAAEFGEPNDDDDEPSDWEVRLICVLPIWLPVVAETIGEEPEMRGWPPAPASPSAPLAPPLLLLDGDRELFDPPPMGIPTPTLDDIAVLLEVGEVEVVVDE